ncbi:pyridoxamine 5'-phosphate oxidase family protein [Roseixanthobacter glucoisosaccharinicivorans]|uniref:pyridoxamine 5'-phosphate oxidase family protein n=1 Tax=Roseixanthobacter glucoisosaccharinicivorans TaxID=3119923 RepID=UPI003729BF72
MTSPLSVPSDIAFSPAVKAIQARKGSRAGYRRMEETGGWRDEITPDLAAFLAAQTSFYLATASAAGQPYIQHRGGPPGFLRVLDAHTIAFADFKGNRQYITLGNLSENPAAHIFLMDYVNRRRIKMWGTARAVEDDLALLEALRVEGYKGVPEQAVVFTLTAWDANCPQHIPQRFEAADVAAALEVRDRRIAELEAQLARLTDTARPGAAQP